MSATSNLSLPFDDSGTLDARLDARDRDGRARAVDPRFNVALEASAGTGKTSVLVDRYINLLRAGVDPSNILAITFTRKAAAEMRGRIISTLRAVAAEGGISPAVWRGLRDRTADIAISTIDAFCLSLLREFPLEAGLDPGFALADETEVPRLVDESLDRALRVCRAVAADDENVALVFAQLGERRARRGLASLLHRRIVAAQVLSRQLTRGPRDLSVSDVSRRGADALLQLVSGMTGGLEAFLELGPPHPGFQLLAGELRGVAAFPAPVRVQAAFARARDLFLTQAGAPRRALDRAYARDTFPTEARWRAFRRCVIGNADGFHRVLHAYRRELNVLVSRGTWRMYRIAETEYRRTLEAHAVLDFSDVLLRALELLRQMEEFSQSRFRLEGRYHHVLVDEFQDTSRAQWELVSLLVASWGQGAGIAHAGPLPPTIFVVGDRKQSIYGFRDADVSLLREVALHLERLRPDGDVKRSISRSFRSVPSLLAFINDVCHDIVKASGRADAFLYEEQDRFPVEAAGASESSLGLIGAESAEACAETAASEISRLLESEWPVRDRATGVRRAIRPGDVAILFRTRDSHREFEAALEARGVPAYVYKGLGFFDADEIKDVLALLWYLADPHSDLRAAALLRSRFVGLSDDALRRLAPRLASALSAGPAPDDAGACESVSLEARDDAVLRQARADTAEWRALVDCIPPAELLDRVLSSSRYVARMRGPRFQQARENLKKMRGLVRRIQNRGYATLGRIAVYLDRLAVGDESNASIDAQNAVNLMTVHAAKGLEFPVVFLVNLARGTGNRRDPIRVNATPADDDVSVAVGDFLSDADEDAAARDSEETKRLLYVALTRARDRLYLTSVLKDGRIQPGRGSLAEILPATLLELFRAPMLEGSEIEWRASSGGRHRIQVCAPEEPRRAAAPLDDRAHGPEDFAPLRSREITRRSVASHVATGSGPLPRALRVPSSDRIAGSVVHRLLRQHGVTALASQAQAQAAALSALRPDELADIVDLERFATEVAAAFVGIVGRADVQALFTSGERLYEVPFSLHRAGEVTRGAVDCLICSPSASAPSRVTVVEFKTGRPRPEHESQLAIYLGAMVQLFPDAEVSSRLVYPEAEPREGHLSLKDRDPQF